MVLFRKWEEKQDFPIKQGFLKHNRVCSLLSKGHCYSRPNRIVKRKHKSVRRCIVDVILYDLKLVIV